MHLDLSLILRIILFIPFLGLLLAPLETVGWWNGWWFKDNSEPDELLDNKPDKNLEKDYEYVVFYLTGIGGAKTDNDIPWEQRFLKKLKVKLHNCLIIDTIYPYSVINRSLTENRLLARFWRFVLGARKRGNQKLGFIINIRNLFQVLLAADDRYGTFFNQGAATVITKKLLKIGYDPKSDIPIIIIGYSGGGQVAAGAAPYIARAVKAPVTVISLAGVLSSNPLIDRVDRLVHIVSDKDKVAELGFIFAGRWPISYFSAWNRAKRKNRIKIIKLHGMQHDAKGSYLDDESFSSDGQSFLDVTINTIAEVIKEKVTAIPDDEGIDFSQLLKAAKRE